MRRILSLWALATLLGGFGPLGAQDCRAHPNLWQFLEQCGQAIVGTDPANLHQALDRAYDNFRKPASLNSALGKIQGQTSYGHLLQGLNLHFVTIQVKREQELGLSYSWSQSLVRTPHAQGSTHWGYDLVASSQGLLTTDKVDNPEQLLEARFHSNFFYSVGGAADSATVAGNVRQIQDSIFAYQAFGSDPPVELSGIYANLWDGLSTELYLTVGPDGRFEANQSFDKKHWAAGVNVGFDLKAWNPDSFLARVNVFDWPAAVMRYLSGVDERIVPRGSSIPTVLLSWHRVSVQANPTRETLEGFAPFSRLGVEVNYRSQMAQSAAGPVWLEMSYRRHEEVDPSQAVRDEKLHSFERFKVGIFGPGGVAVWWATGRLPMDEDNTDHFGLGFLFRF